MEVTGRYSKLSDQGERVRTLLEIVPEGAARVKVRTPRQVQHRLQPDEVDQLTRLYEAGATVVDLAARFGVHRTTVFAILDHSDVKRHRRGIPARRVAEAIELYQGGASLKVVGTNFSVNASTVGNDVAQSWRGPSTTERVDLVLYRHMRGTIDTRREG